MSGRTLTLAVVGASARAAAQSALRAGFRVVAADLFADADLAAHCRATKVDDYPEGFLDWLAKTVCDGWLYTGGLENHPELVDRMAAIRPLWGNHGESLRAARDVFNLQTLLVGTGLSFPETRDSAVGLPLDGSWLCKTGRGAGGSGVWLLDGAEARNRAVREGACFQRFVGGSSAAAIFVLGERSSRLGGMTLQFVGPFDGHGKPWQYVGSLSPWHVSTSITPQLERLQHVLARDLGLRGIVGVDLVLDDERAWIIEINPRYTASVEVVERTVGGLVAAHAAACTDPNWSAPADDLPTEDKDTTRRFAKATFYASRTAMISEKFHRWALAESSLDVEDRRLADIPHAGESIPAGRPLLTVFGEGPGLTAIDQVRRRFAEVEARLYAEGG